MAFARVAAMAAALVALSSAGCISNSDRARSNAACVELASHGLRPLADKREDRFLGSIGRSQRFATQYNSSGPNAPFRLAPVEDGVTDALRRELNAPTLAEAKAREAAFNK